MTIYQPVLRAGVRKPSGKEPAGARLAACRLWGFDGAAPWAGVALAGVVGGRSTIAVDNFSPPPPSSRGFWHARRHAVGVWKHRDDNGATPGASFPGGQMARSDDGRHGAAVLTRGPPGGGPRGAPLRSMISTMIIRPPQQGHGGQWSIAAPAV